MVHIQFCNDGKLPTRFNDFRVLWFVHDPVCGVEGDDIHLYAEIRCERWYRCAFRAHAYGHVHVGTHIHDSLDGSDQIRICVRGLGDILICNDRIISVWQYDICRIQWHYDIVCCMAEKADLDKGAFGKRMDLRIRRIRQNIRGMEIHQNYIYQGGWRMGRCGSYNK